MGHLFLRLRITLPSRRESVTATMSHTAAPTQIHAMAVTGSTPLTCEGSAERPNLQSAYSGAAGSQHSD